MKKIYPVIDSAESLEAALKRVRAAQKRFAEYSQSQVDSIFKAAAAAADRQRIPLARLAVEETGMGVVEDKVIKNHYAAEYIYNAYKDTKTCGVIEEDKEYGITRIAEPIGVIAAVIPTTNPTSTAIFKTLLALKTRNGIIISPHPRAKNSTAEAARTVLEAAVAAGAPEDIIAWIDKPSLEMTDFIMKEADIILATGGPGMVHAAYSSGKPAIGVGAGNTPAVIDTSADITLAVNSIIHSKTFDNGMICASEQSVIVLDKVYKKVKKEFADRGCYFLDRDETNKVRKTVIINGAINAKIVGQTAKTIADLADVRVPDGTKILIGEVESVEPTEEFAHEKLSPSLTLGCGSWGGNSVSENVGVKHLLNIKTVAERRENMLWFRSPEKVYINKGCLPTALEEFKAINPRKKAFIVTDRFLYENGCTKPITDKLNEMDIAYTVFSEVEPDPTLKIAKKGAEMMTSFAPDVIIAIGGGSAMDAAKIMWVLYEHPDADFTDMAMRFSDIRKRIYTFPKMGEKAYFTAVPTSAGTGSEVTPFAVITDSDTGIKYPLADYELMPNMAIVDADLQMSAPKGLTAASGIDAVSHGMEAFASMLATDYTDSLALRSLKIMFEYLPRAYENGEGDPEAREKTANAATMAGMAFANAFLGVCHSMAHKLGAFHHLPHGIANALMLDEVIRFNSADVPAKMGTFPQYAYPHTKARYAEIADYLTLGGKTDDEKVENLIAALDALKEKIGIKKTIRDYVPDEEDFLNRLDSMTEQAFDDQCTGANPRYPLMSEIKQMYLNAYYGTHEKI